MMCWRMMRVTLSGEASPMPLNRPFSVSTMAWQMATWPFSSVGI